MSTSISAWATQSWHEHLNPSTADIPPKVTAHFGGWNRISDRSFFLQLEDTNKKYIFAKKNGGKTSKTGSAMAETICSHPPYRGSPLELESRILKVYFKGGGARRLKSILSTFCIVNDIYFWQIASCFFHKKIKDVKRRKASELLTKYDLVHISIKEF